MPYLYSIPLEVTGPSITHHCIQPIDWMTVFRVSLLSEEDFAKQSILSTSDTFNSYFNTLAKFKHAVAELGANRSVSWTTQKYLHVICNVPSDVEKYLKKKGCLRSKITLRKSVTKDVFNLNYYPKGSDKPLYLGHDEDKELTVENVKEFNIPSCTFEHCIREYLLSLKQDQVGVTKVFIEDGNRFEITTERKTITTYI